MIGGFGMVRCAIILFLLYGAYSDCFASNRKRKAATGLNKTSCKKEKRASKKGPQTTWKKEVGEVPLIRRLPIVGPLAMTQITFATCGKSKDLTAIILDYSTVGYPYNTISLMRGSMIIHTGSYTYHENEEERVPKWIRAIVYNASNDPGFKERVAQLGLPPGLHLTTGTLLKKPQIVVDVIVKTPWQITLVGFHRNGTTSDIGLAYIGGKQTQWSALCCDALAASRIEKQSGVNKVICID
jgi:hypothetical protein